MTIQATTSYTLPRREEVVSKLHDELTGKIDFFNRVQKGGNKEKVIRRLNLQIIDKLFGKLPRTVPSLFIVHWNESDGGGDISFALKTTSTLQKEFPCSHVFAIVPDGIMEKTRTLCPEYVQDILIDNSKEVYHKTVQQKKFQLQTASIRAKIKNELGKRSLTEDGIDEFFSEETEKPLLINFNVATPDSIHLGDSDLSFTFHIDEYNGWRAERDQEDCDEGCTWLVAGVGFTDNFPATGIHLDPSIDPKLPDEQRRRELANLENEELKALLQPESQHPLHFAYHSNGEINSLMAFLKTIIERMNRSTVDVVIVSSSVERIINQVLEEFRECPKFSAVSYPLLRNHKIHKLTLTGKCNLRIITVASVIHRDMLTLMRSSQKMMHTSGDQSLAEALSIRGNILFYQLQDWKKDLLKQLKRFAKYSVGADSSLVKFLKACKHGYDEEHMRSVNMEELSEEFALFHDKLREWYTFDDWLVGAANYTLIDSLHSEISSYVDNLDSSAPLTKRALNTLFNKAVRCLGIQPTDLKKRKVTKK